MSEILSTREIDDLLRIIQCDSDKKVRRMIFVFTFRTKLRRIICRLLRKEDDSPSDGFFDYISRPVKVPDGPVRIYPYDPTR